MNHPTTPLRGAAGTPGRGELRIVRGDATPEEIAALVAVLASRQRPVVVEARRSAWARQQPRTPLPPPGPGAWRAAVS